MLATEMVTYHTIGMNLFSGLSRFRAPFYGDKQSALNRDTTVLVKHLFALTIMFVIRSLSRVSSVVTVGAPPASWLDCNSCGYPLGR